MPKGKTNQPLRLYVEGDLYDTQEIQKLIQQGNAVTRVSAYKAGVLLLGEHCFRSSKELVKYVKLALTSARAERYPKGSRKPTTKKEAS